MMRRGLEAEDANGSVPRKKPKHEEALASLSDSAREKLLWEGLGWRHPSPYYWERKLVQQASRQLGLQGLMAGTYATADPDRAEAARLLCQVLAYLTREEKQEKKWLSAPAIRRARAKGREGQYEQNPVAMLLELLPAETAAGFPRRGHTLKRAYVERMLLLLEPAQVCSFWDMFKPVKDSFYRRLAVAEEPARRQRLGAQIALAYACRDDLITIALGATGVVLPAFLTSLQAHTQEGLDRLEGYHLKLRVYITRTLAEAHSKEDKELASEYSSLGRCLLTDEEMAQGLQYRACHFATEARDLGHLADWGFVRAPTRLPSFEAHVLVPSDSSSPCVYYGRFVWQGRLKFLSAQFSRYLSPTPVAANRYYRDKLWPRVGPALASATGLPADLLALVNEYVTNLYL